MYALGDKDWPGISKVTEEVGEVIEAASAVVSAGGRVLRVVGKLMGKRGAVKHWNVPDLRSALEDEFGDLMAAMDFAIESCGLDRERIVRRWEGKRRMLDGWARRDEGGEGRT